MKKQEVEMTERMKSFNFFPTGNIQMLLYGFVKPCPTSRLAARLQGRSAPSSPG